MIIVLLTKRSGRSESPLSMQISGWCIAYGWAKEFKQQRKPLLPQWPQQQKVPFLPLPSQKLLCFEQCSSLKLKPNNNEKAFNHFVIVLSFSKSNYSRYFISKASAQCCPWCIFLSRKTLHMWKQTRLYKALFWKALLYKIFFIIQFLSCWEIWRNLSYIHLFSFFILSLSLFLTHTHLYQ